MPSQSLDDATCKLHSLDLVLRDPQHGVYLSFTDDRDTMPVAKPAVQGLPRTSLPFWIQRAMVQKIYTR